VVGLTTILAAVYGFAYFIRSDAGVVWALGSLTHGGWSGIWQGAGVSSILSPPFLLQPLLLATSTAAALALTICSRGQTGRTLGLALVLGILAYDLTSFARTYNTSTPRSLEFPATDAIEFLQRDETKFRVVVLGRFQHNSLAPFGIEDVGGYASLYPRRYGEAHYLSETGRLASPGERFSRWLRFSPGGSLIDVLNVKYFVAPKAVGSSSPRLELVYDRELKIFRYRDAFDRIFLVPHYELAPTRRDAYAALARFGRRDFERKVLLEEPLPRGIDLAAFQPKPLARSDVRITSYTANRISFEVNAERDCFAVIGDSFHPDWKAEIDGKPEPILRANYIMRAVALPAGRHSVTLRFEPTWLIVGHWTTIAGWSALVLALAALAWRDRSLKT
jgi:hypothetical protein